MNRTLCLWTLAGALLLCGPARADDGGGEGEAEPNVQTGGATVHRGSSGQGSFLSGRTLGANSDGIAAQFGWPGMSLEYLHGQSSDLDFGGTFTFNYGFEGITYIDPGIKLQGALRLKLLDQNKLNLGLRLDPGIAMYFKNAFTFGLTVPVALALGVSVGDAMMLHFGFDLPMTIFLVPDTEFVLPILMGVGLEYHLDSHLSVLLDTRFGPELFITRHTETQFAFRTLVGVGYRF